MGKNVIFSTKRRCRVLPVKPLHVSVGTVILDTFTPVTYFYAHCSHNTVSFSPILLTNSQVCTTFDPQLVIDWVYRTFWPYLKKYPLIFEPSLWHLTLSCYSINELEWICHIFPYYSAFSPWIISIFLSTRWWLLICLISSWFLNMLKLYIVSIYCSYTWQFSANYFIWILLIYSWLKSWSSFIWVVY